MGVFERGLGFGLVTRLIDWKDLRARDSVGDVGVKRNMKGEIISEVNHSQDRAHPSHLQPIIARILNLTSYFLRSLVHPSALNFFIKALAISLILIAEPSVSSTSILLHFGLLVSSFDNGLKFDKSDLKVIVGVDLQSFNGR